MHIIVLTTVILFPSELIACSSAMKITCVAPLQDSRGRVGAWDSVCQERKVYRWRMNSWTEGCSHSFLITIILVIKWVRGEIIAVVPWRDMVDWSASRDYWDRISPVSFDITMLHVFWQEIERGLFDYQAEGCFPVTSLSIEWVDNTTYTSLTPPEVPTRYIHIKMIMYQIGGWIEGAPLPPSQQFTSHFAGCQSLKGRERKGGKKKKGIGEQLQQRRIIIYYTHNYLLLCISIPRMGAGAWKSMIVTKKRKINTGTAEK